MNQEETIALWKRCEAARADALAAGKDEDAAHEAAKAVWNGWAEEMLVARKALEAAGEWAATEDNLGLMQPRNTATSQWFKMATVDFSAHEFNLDPLTMTANPPTIIKTRTDFGGFAFPGISHFERTNFFHQVCFREARFFGDALFWGAKFHDELDFTSAHFDCAAIFGNALFVYSATFVNSRFKGVGGFEYARFEKTGNFIKVSFSKDANFRGVFFGANAIFAKTTFSQNAYFNNSDISGLMMFSDAIIVKNCYFSGSTFSNKAYFSYVKYLGKSCYEGARFENFVSFSDVEFKDDTNFFLVVFDTSAQFDCARFRKGANFGAIRGERAFSLANAKFDGVPDFIQAHFEEAPRLDNIRVHARMIDPPAEDEPIGSNPSPYLLPQGEGKDRDTSPPLPEGEGWGEGGKRLRIPRNGYAALRKVNVGIRRRITWPKRAAVGAWRRVVNAHRDQSDIPARFRALKRLAIQGHDADREHEFFGREIRHARFVTDWPLHWKLWRLSAWSAMARFWFGWFYQVLGGLGVSWVKPFAWWLAAAVLSAAFYLGESPEMEKTRQAQQSNGVAWYIATYDAWTKPLACYAPPTPAETSTPYVGALSEQVRGKTSAPTEALHLAFRNAFIVLDNGGDAAHRSYGCLYGVELFGGSNPVAVVPSAVSIVSAAQKLFSALCIFLFGLAVRNMLKMK